MGGTVLFVDDEKAILNALQALFEDDDDISVVVAGDGDSALEVLSTQRVDFLVSDQIMPGTDGAALLRRVRKLYPDIPSALLTGNHEFDPAEIDDLAGGVPVIYKPWDAEEIRELVRGTLTQKELDPEQVALMRVGGLKLKQLQRAERIRERMQQALPLGEVLVQLGELTPEEYARVVQARRRGMSLAALLHEDGHLTDDDLAAYEIAKKQSPALDDRQLLLNNELVSEEQFLRALSSKHGIPYVEPDLGTVNTALLGKTSTRYLLRQKALPLRVEDHKLLVIVSDPLDTHLLSELQRIFGFPVSPCCCVAEKICEALRTLDRLGSAKEKGGATSLQYRVIETLTDGEEMSEEAVQMVDYLLLRAIQLGASDLHIEPLQEKIRARVRVDGSLQKLTDLPIAIASRLASRVKILAGCDIAEKRLHQDGKIFVKVEGHEVDIRVSTYVSMYGETLVLRLLDRNRNLMQLEDVGFEPRILSVIDEVILQSSSGLVLITGPTGSGKTTTLYSFVQHALDPEEKVITCEDPVEYVVDGATQCSVNEKTGPTFADSLRAIVRQDPDTIVVGEIRDPSTAGLAFESALTGHKVYSTFHTEDAVSVIIRLLEMGIEPFLVASSLSAVIAQRLVRRVCPRCRKPGQPGRAEMRFLGLEKSDLKGVTFYEAQGCGQCGGAGYKGRMGIHEVLIPDDDFRDAVMHRVSAKDLRAQARNLTEFLTLQEDALLKVATGLTTLRETADNVPRDSESRPLATLMRIAGIGRK